jgi:undecaprenyl-diphosphatase
MVARHNPKIPVITKKLVVHSPGTFGGAWLLSRKFPRFGILRYMIAGMVAFSRIYLGDHYPGDVASGSALGMLFAMFFRWLARFLRKR